MVYGSNQLWKLWKSRAKRKRRAARRETKGNRRGAQRALDLRCFGSPCYFLLVWREVAAAGLDLEPFRGYLDFEGMVAAVMFDGFKGDGEQVDGFRSGGESL